MYNQAGADANIPNGGQRTASELVRLEIADLEDYVDELRLQLGHGGSEVGVSRPRFRDLKGVRVALRRCV